MNILDTLALYGSENGTLKEKGKSRITKAESKILRKTIKYAHSMTIKEIKIV